jgi:hypothetical protein
MGWPTVLVGLPLAVAATATAPCTHTLPRRQQPAFCLRRPQLALTAAVRANSILLFVILGREG